MHKFDLNGVPQILISAEDLLDPNVRVLAETKHWINEMLHTYATNRAKAILSNPTAKLLPEKYLKHYIWLSNLIIENKGMESNE